MTKTTIRKKIVIFQRMLLLYHIDSQKGEISYNTIQDSGGNRMKFSTKVLLAVNRLFPAVVHPFNLQTKGEMSYAEWQYQKGEDTIRYFLPYHSTDFMFRDKTVLDIGCGAGGKTIYYASLGVHQIIGLEILDKYKEEAEQIAKKYHQEKVFSYHTGDAAKMSFESNTFDTIIMNDAMEHVADPEAVLRDCYRVLKPGGYLYINFPPYYHPFGAHLSDAISIPWVHAFFAESTLIEAYRALLQHHPDLEERISFRFSQDEKGETHLTYINKMTIRRCRKIVPKIPFRQVYYYEDPLRKALAPIRPLPFCREWLTKMVVCILQKPLISHDQSTISSL